MSRVTRFHAKALLLAPHMTDEVRTHVLNHGWDPEVANSLSVEYKDGKFVVQVPDEYHDRAWMHEYGSPTSPPTAAIRNYGKVSWGGSR